MKNKPKQHAAHGDDEQSPDASDRAGARGLAPDAEVLAEIARLTAERDEAVESWKRAQADYQNLRRRLQSDIDAAVQRSKHALLQQLLLVVDYLEMALATPVATGEGKNLLAGVEMTRAALLRALEQENARPIPEGGRFDPAIHEAVESVATSEQEPGTVLATLRRGYMIGPQVLRAAQARVAVAPGAGDRAQAMDESEDES